MKYSGKNSIDSFLEHRTEFKDIGKFAIANALIPYEIHEKLFIAEDDWYGYLFQLMNSGLDDFPKNNLSIVTFNYDRSIETYLYLALKNSYGLPVETAKEITNSIPIIHVHGKLSKSIWEEDDGRLYNQTHDVKKIQESSRSIKIIHEDIDSDPEFTQAHNCLCKAKKIVFLGFGYHPENMKRLQTPFNNCDQILGSCIGFEELEIETKEQQHPEIKFGRYCLDTLDYLRKHVVLL